MELTSTTLQALASLLFLCIASTAAIAEGSLTGREVTVYVLTYDDPARPLFLAIIYLANLTAAEHISGSAVVEHHHR